jgi:hypothetical protein
MIAVQVADLDFVPFWPVGAAVKAISSATVTVRKGRPKRRKNWLRNKLE